METTFISRHVKGKSLSITSENKDDKIKSLKNRMENPFWVPSNNSDLFLIKQIYKEDKKMQKAINLSKTRSPLSKFRAPSTNFTMKNLKAFTNTYLTEQAKMNSTLDTKNDSHTNSFGSTNPTKMLEMIRKKMISSMPVSPKINNTLINKKISGIKEPQFESIRDYIEKTRQLILMKYQTKIKGERIVRMEETYRNEIESVKDSIISITNAKNKFEEEFFKKYQKYMKFLSVDKEREKKLLNNLLDEKSSHDADIKQYENRINKLKDKIELYNEYKLFLICIKEKKLYFVKQAKPPLLNNHNSTLESVSTIKDKDSIHHHSLSKDSLYMTSTLMKFSKCMNKNKLRKPKMNIFDKSHTVDEEEEIHRLMNYYDSDHKKVFVKQEELINEMKRMEVKNLDLLSQVNELEQIVSDTVKETRNIEVEDKYINKYIIDETQRKETELIEIKEKYIRLKEEKDKLEKNRFSIYNSNTEKANSMTKNKIFRTQLFSKIMMLYKKCNDLNIFEENGTEKNKKNQVNNDNQLEMMRLIEKTFQYLSKKFVEYSLYHTEELKKFEKDLESERKRQIALEQTKENEKKTENLIQKITEKYNKVVIKATRKIPQKFRPEEKKKKNKAFTKIDNEPNFMELLHYEGDDNNYK